MRVEIYNALMARQKMNRRTMLQGAASVGALAAIGGAVPKMGAAAAHTDVRAQILQIPGVGQGCPTDADWQKVGELVPRPTKERVAEGEFAGVELTFMGLNNQNLHNFLFRGFLKPWETYTGAKINWIDLAQADYNPRLQQSIATGTVDFDIIEMGAPFEGDTAGKGLLDEMPDWVAEQIDVERPRELPEAAGRHLGRQDLPHHHRRRLPHLRLPQRLFRRRRDRRRPRFRRPGSRSTQVTKDLKGKKDPLTGLGAYGYPRPAEGLGRLRLLLPREPRRGLCQAPRRPGLAVRPRDDEAAASTTRAGCRRSRT